MAWLINLSLNAKHSFVNLLPKLFLNPNPYGPNLCIVIWASGIITGSQEAVFSRLEENQWAWPFDLTPFYTDHWDGFQHKCSQRSMAIHFSSIDVAYPLLWIIHEEFFFWSDRWMLLSATWIFGCTILWTRIILGIEICWYLYFLLRWWTRYIAFLLYKEIDPTSSARVLIGFIRTLSKIYTIWLSLMCWLLVHIILIAFGNYVYPWEWKPFDGDCRGIGCYVKNFCIPAHYKLIMTQLWCLSIINGCGFWTCDYSMFLYYWLLGPFVAHW